MAVWANDGASWYLSEILKSYESADSRDLRMSDDGTTYLAPLFPSSSGPADDNSEPEIKVVSVALPGAGAIPASVNNTGSGSGGFAVASELVVPSHAALQTGLPTEIKAVLPTDPPFRWFRPPKGF